MLIFLKYPDYQGRGYFKKLANHLYNELKKDGFIGVFGFANQNSHYGFRKYLNWQDLAILNNFSVERTNFKTSIISQDIMSEHIVEELSEGIINRLENYYCSSASVILKRDAANLLWRFHKNPSNTYFVISHKIEDTEVSVIFKKYMNSIDVMEVFIKNEISEHNNNCFLLCIKTLLADYGNSINIWSNIYSNEHLLFEKIGFKKGAFSTYFGYIPFRNDIQEVFSIKNWHYRFCDSDVY